MVLREVILSPRLLEFDGASGVPFRRLLEGEFARSGECGFLRFDLQQPLEFNFAVYAQARGRFRVGGQNKAAEREAVGGAAGNVVAGFYVVGLIAHGTIPADANAITQRGAALLGS